MRVVLDTNIWVSAFLSPLGAPGQLLDLVVSGRLRVATSNRLWDELARIVHEPKVRNVLEMHGTWEAVEHLLSGQPHVEFVETETPTDRWVPDDPDDNWVIQAAITADAEYIVTGDRHLLGLGEAGPITVVSPAGLLALLAP